MTLLIVEYMRHLGELIPDVLNVAPTIYFAYLTFAGVLARQCSRPLAISKIGSGMCTCPNAMGPTLLAARPS